MSKKTRYFFIPLMLGILVTLAPALSMAHGRHGPHHKVVIVKPAPPAKVVVVKTRPACHRGHWHAGHRHCHRHPGRVLTHAVADLIWRESVH